MTRLPLSGSGSASSAGRRFGTICQDRPYLSLSQPHWTGLPPPAVRADPEPVDLVLILATDGQRNRVVELVVRAAVQGLVILAGKLELDHEDGARLGTRRIRGRSLDRHD